MPLVLLRRRGSSEFAVRRGSGRWVLLGWRGEWEGYLEVGVGRCSMRVNEVFIFGTES